jgi:signal peptidase I
VSDKVRKRGWRARDIALTALLLIILGSLVIARVLYTPYRIPSGSMTPTLLVGEYVAAPNRAPHVRIGEVVFHTQAGEGTFVRRVLALPGQRIAFRDGVPIVDGVMARQAETGEVGSEGERIVQETLAGRSYRVAYRGDGAPELRDMPERVVPPGRVFLVGDARDNSLDSRINGPQPISSIRHSGGWIIYSPDGNRVGHRIE